MLVAVYMYTELRLRSNGCFDKTTRRNRADVTAGMARFKALVQGTNRPKRAVRVCLDTAWESGIFWIGWKKKVRFGSRPSV